MYEIMCIVWQLVGTITGLLFLYGLIYSVITGFSAKEETDHDD